MPKNEENIEWRRHFNNKVSHTKTAYRLLVLARRLEVRIARAHESRNGGERRRLANGMRGRVEHFDGDNVLEIVGRGRGRGRD